MSYTKKKIHYYAIPTLGLDDRFVIVTDDGEEKKIIDHVNESFPILGELVTERLAYYFCNIYNRTVSKEVMLEYKSFDESIKTVLDELQLPKYIFALGTSNEAKEFLTGKTIKYTDHKRKSLCSLNDYSISEYEFDKYSTDNYEGKVKNFFDPSEEIKRRADFTIEDFDKEIKMNKVLKKGMK